MGNGDGEDGDAILLPGVRDQLLVLLLWGFGLRQWRMEKDVSHLLPAARAAGHVYLPIRGRTMGNGANGWSNDSWEDIQ